MDIFCADIGSVKHGNFGWYGRLAGGSVAQGEDIVDLADVIAGRLNQSKQVALGFEAPMFVPLRSDPMTLTQKRDGETDKNWIGGPGATVLATALVQIPWLLTAIYKKLTVEGAATVNWTDFQAKKATLFLWEAFVSGSAKGTSHVDDARIAVEHFYQAIPDPKRHNVIHESTVLSILGASLLRTGWTSDLELLRLSPLVLRPNAVKKISKKKRRYRKQDRDSRKRCPECGYQFKGPGWGGIDAHWNAAHTDIMSYADAWPLIKNGKRPSDYV